MLPPEELPGIAVAALVGGVDSPSLRQLAGMSRRDDPRELSERFAAALRELGIEVTRGDALDYLLIDSMEGWHSGVISTSDLAMRVDGLGYLVEGPYTPERERALQRIVNQLERLHWTVPREKQEPGVQEALEHLRALVESAE